MAYRTSTTAPRHPLADSNKFYRAIFNGREPSDQEIVEIKIEDLPLDIQAKFWEAQPRDHAGLGRMVIIEDVSDKKEHEVFFEVHAGHHFNTTAWRWDPKFTPWSVANMVNVYMTSRYSTKEQKEYAAAIAENYWYDRD